MYALRDREHPDATALTNYYRTFEEAAHARAERTMFKAGVDEPIPGAVYLEIIEVERESRPCRYCGEEIQATHPEVDYCRACFYSGRSQDDACAEHLAALLTIPTAKDASVWHTGGGCFCLGVTFEDGASLLVSNEASVTDENGKAFPLNEPVWGCWCYEGEDDEEGEPLDTEKPYMDWTIPQIVKLASARFSGS